MVSLFTPFGRHKTDNPDRTALPALILIVLFTALMAIVATAVGPEDIPFLSVIHELFGANESPHGFIIQSLRLPRIAMALLVGAGLGVSGLILQTLVRNPLASPEIIGITGGASVAVVIYFGWLAPVISVTWMPLIASAGSAVAAITIFLLAWSGSVEPARLILIGIGISATFGALTTLLMVFSTEMTNLSAYIWLTGSVYGADWTDVRHILPWVLLPLPPLIFLGRTLNTLLLGHDVATSLGIPVQIVRLIALGACVILASAAVAYAGAIGFVGLLAPHIARRLVKNTITLQIPATACIGGLLVLIADTAGRTLFGSLDLPAGIFVSAIGTPFFIYLLYRQR
ncbi:iron ABC transporter permease [Thalassospiraceae bacterium SW-3-3]|nr:iron ABC transporter permease [Thalassospiraceae bacterium SW-3-3]